MTPIAQLAIIQVGIPLLLILLNAVVPASSWWALGLRALLLATGLAWLILGGTWLYPPWWTPFVLVVLALASFVRPVLRLSRRGTTRRRGWRWSETTIVALLVVAVVALLVVPAAAGRSQPPGAVDIAEPLDPGAYYVTSGGSRSAVNRHLLTSDSDQWRGQRRGVDLVKVDGLGRRAHGIAPADPAAYYIYGAPVISPCVGTVAETRADLPDHRVPDIDSDNPAGNYVLVSCGDYEVLLAHLQHESVVVRAGDHVEIGVPLGKVGNSGDAAEPHLHIHAQRRSPDPAKPFAGDPLWLTIDGHFPVRNRLLRL
ncbi:M23 family metallopeptidase [Gordonia sp. PP30]|uniref:M23 family metallopeptidase n=1 Tax=Gordonia sp. PP30 TaxID=2935861 RepID=UPI001FFE3324|nr:M23 family metallopeptidase [Gordonia sp. PP30]UQE76020.1 M23 family metallopeptidase [Gordonia sp. PP30]